MGVVSADHDEQANAEMATAKPRERQFQVTKLFHYFLLHRYGDQV